MTTPIKEPIYRRKLQLTDLENNNNKIWMVEFYADNQITVTWGRVGATPQVQKKANYTQAKVDKMVKEKTDKGYVDVELHVPDVVDDAGDEPVVQIQPEVQKFLELTFSEAGQNIDSYLSVGVDTLSKNQIDAGRELLRKYADLYPEYQRGLVPIGELIGVTEMYYNRIPTKLPHNIVPERITLDMYNQLADYEDRLNQLESAIGSFGIRRRNSNANLLQQLGGGVNIEALDPLSDEYRLIEQRVMRELNPSHVPTYSWETTAKVKWIFSVDIPAASAAYENETKGSSCIRVLWHGSKTHYVNSILGTGLTIPIHVDNGRRLGDGVYLADMALRSLRYAGSKNSSDYILYLVETKLGNIKDERGTASYTSAPTGYDSVRGTDSHGGMDEFVVYKPSQQVIRGVVVLSR
jgi:predicted DNA-binding WGR domain protein